ncbi:MAG: phage holin family protein [Xanthobacteraceae bacterium]|nr:phage holin family protein [Xanthobacteraceae bacterium]
MKLRRTRYQYGRMGDRTEGFGPQFAFAAATLTGFTVWAGCAATLPHGFGAPIVTTVFFVLGAIFAIVAWRCRKDDPTNITYTDVAGALTLIGLCLSATIEPDPLLRLVQGGGEEH